MILNQDALDVIRTQDGEKTLFYLDPPYVPHARATVGNYAHEMTKVQAKIDTWQKELRTAILEERGTHIDRALEMIKIYSNDLAYYARHASDHSAVLKQRELYPETAV